MNLLLINHKRKKLLKIRSHQIMKLFNCIYIIKIKLHIKMTFKLKTHLLRI